MTELELYKFIKENDIEYHYYSDNCSFTQSRKRIIMFVDIFYISEFVELLGKHVMEDEGIKCTMKYRYFCFEMVEICEYFDIVPENVFVNRD